MAFPDPGSWVDPEVSNPEPWKTQGGIVKFMEFVVPIPEMSHRAFHLYWQKHHSPNVMNVTVFAQFMRKYNSGHRYPATVPYLPDRYLQDVPLQGAAEVWLNAIDKVGEWLGLPEYAGIIQPDEPRFISQDGRVEVVITKEERLFETDPDLQENGLTKVYLLTRREQGVDYDSFHFAASAFGRKILLHPNLLRHLRKLVISHKLREPLPMEGFRMSEIDAVFELWFDDLAGVQRFFSEPDFENQITRAEAGVFDTSSLRAVVAKMRVVHDEFSFQPSTTQPLPFRW